VTRHLLWDQGGPHALSDATPIGRHLTELTPEEAAARWERLRIVPCEECSELMHDAIVYHETG